MVYRPQTHLETRGIVLATTPVRDADLIITVLSPELGKISCVVRGARGSKKRFLGGFDLFDAGSFKLTRGSGEESLYNLSAVRDREPWPSLRQDLDKFSYAVYCLEITAGLAADGDSSAGELYPPLFTSLRLINRAGRAAEVRAIAVYFNLLALQLAGFNLLDAPEVAADHPNCFAWFDAMVRGSQVIVPHEPALLREGTVAVCRFTEQILGRRIRSSENFS